MNFQKLQKKILNSSPRELYYELLGKTLRRNAKLAGGKLSSVFVLSTGRVGTETLDALFQYADNFFSYHEPKPTIYRLSKLAYGTERNPLAQNILREAFLTARQDLLDYSLQCGRGYAETSPQVTFLAPIILDAIPQAKFIHLVRDPRAVIRSGMRRKWYDGHPSDFTRITPLPDSWEAKQWDSYSCFQKNLWLWAETNRWIMQFLMGVPLNQKLLLHAEDMFAGDEMVIMRVFNFIASKPPSKRTIQRILGKRLNAQESGEFQWNDELQHALLEVTGDVVAQLGYAVR